MALAFRTRRAGSHAHESTATTEPLVLMERRPDEMSALEHAALVAGRVVFGGYFVYSGIRHFAQRQMFIAYTKSKGVKWPELAVLGSGAMLVAGGLSLLTGIKPKVGAALVTGFLTGATPLMHDYWNATDDTQRMNDKVNFTKNLALIGGAAFAAAASQRAPLQLAS